MTISLVTTRPIIIFPEVNLIWSGLLLGLVIVIDHMMSSFKQDSLPRRRQGTKNYELFSWFPW
jgi:hypothetical protein